MLVRHKEKTRFRVRISFTDNGTRVAPASARWRLSCETTDTDLTGWANIVVPSSGQYELELPATLMGIINTANRTERKILSVEANYDTPDQVSDELEIDVKNLRKTV